MDIICVKSGKLEAAASVIGRLTQTEQMLCDAFESLTVMTTETSSCSRWWKPFDCLYSLFPLVSCHNKDRNSLHGVTHHPFASTEWCHVLLRYGWRCTLWLSAGSDVNIAVVLSLPLLPFLVFMLPSHFHPPHLLPLGVLLCLPSSCLRLLLYNAAESCPDLFLGNLLHGNCAHKPSPSVALAASI